MRLCMLVLLVALAGCSKQEAEAPDKALRHAMELRDKGDFTGAATVLSAALQAPHLSDAQHKDLAFQLDVLRRIKMDYSFSRTELYNRLSDAVQDLSQQEFDEWIAQGRFDHRMIDGKDRFTDTSVANLFFRYPELRNRRMDGHDDVTEQKGRWLDSVMIKKAALEQKTPYVLPHYFLATMSLTVKEGAVPTPGKKDGQMIRAWLPIPRDYPYQNDFNLISSSSPVLKLAPADSPIRSAYLEQNTSQNRPTTFSVTYSYMRSGVYFDMDPAKVRPADLSNPELKKFTSEAPHIVFTDKLKSLADEIAGYQTNPLLVAKSFYDWIGGNIKYSYAREYSTLTNISDYCLSNRYGDCGQGALLFITLCRSRGIPARWQSGWDLYPGFHDIHDWTEIYIAPYGWVPVDPWAGLFATRYCTALTPAQRKELHDFYFGGLDYYRMAANGDHSQTLDPPKQSLRSDDVDFQRGEVETSHRNIYFDKYSFHMDLQEFGCPPFAARDFKDFPALTDRLKRQADPVSVFMWRRLSDDDHVLLMNYEPSGQSLKRAEAAVLQALNDLIEIGNPCIYDRDRFAGVSLSPETAGLLQEKKPTEADLSRLNRMLLEAAYPELE